MWKLREKIKNKNVGGQGWNGEWARYSRTYIFRVGVDTMGALKRKCLDGSFWQTMFPKVWKNPSVQRADVFYLREEPVSDKIKQTKAKCRIRADVSSREDTTGLHSAEVVLLLSNWPVSHG